MLFSKAAGYLILLIYVVFIALPVGGGIGWFIGKVTPKVETKKGPGIRFLRFSLPDNQTVQTSYKHNSVTAIDQVNRKIQRQSDGLGRLVTVNEQDGTGALAQARTTAPII